MIIFPAIDLKDKKVVRLLQGHFDKITEYSDDPIAVAKKWQKKGAQWLHVVDLDGAQTGTLINSDIVINIAKSVNIPVQTGGGIRKKEDAEKLLKGGVSRVILGSTVVDHIELLTELVNAWPGKIAVSLDCSDGMVMQRAWTSQSHIKATDLVNAFDNLALACIIYTDISRDGTLTGPNFAALKEILNATQIPVIASGGVSSLNDLKELKNLEKDGLLGAITGKAIYEGKFDLKEAITLCSQNE